MPGKVRVQGFSSTRKKVSVSTVACLQCKARTKNTVAVRGRGRLGRGGKEIERCWCSDACQLTWIDNHGHYRPVFGDFALVCFTEPGLGGWDIR